MIGILILILTFIHSFESLELNVAVNAEKSNSTKKRVSAPRKAVKPDRGLSDDIAQVVAHIETMKLRSLIDIPPLKNFTDEIDNDTVSDPDLVQYISEVQAIVVSLRQSYLDILRDHSEWTARWYEVHFPDYYGCVTRNLIRLMRESLIAYPKKVIIKIRAVKDAILRSYISAEPISKVDPDVFDGLEELLRQMPEVLRDHREGRGEKVDGIEYLLEARVRINEEEVRSRCSIPLTDGHNSREDWKFGPDYQSDEDYDPSDYFMIG